MPACSGPILGWDVGGANVKAARVEIDRGGLPSTPVVLERFLPLWREPHRLTAVLAETAGHLGRAGAMAVTMTAELADCFATKREGVGFVLDAFDEAFPGVDLLVYGVDGRFRSAAEARREPLEVAAANWMAGAALVARIVPDALFVDVGSTTADIIPIVSGRVAACGRTDPARLASGELVYTGAQRTPVCAIVHTVPFGGRRCRVAAEHFAVAADVHVWLGRLGEADYTCETPDGRSRNRAAAGERLARMVCADREMVTDDDITAIAENVAAAQVRQIAAGIGQVRRRLGPVCPRVAVLAGQGTFLARAAAERCGLAASDLADRLGREVARAVPAAAVAHLLAAARSAS